MIFLNYLLLALDSIKHRRLRSWLTMIGIFIGVAAVVSLISLGQGMQSSIESQFEMMGSNKLIIMPGVGMGMMPTSEKLTSKDLTIVEKVKGVDIVTEMIYSSSLIEFKDEARHTLVIGLPTDDSANIFKDMQGFETEKGRDLKEGDKLKAVIGYLVARDNGFFEEGAGIRDRIIIKGEEFRVVGIMEQVGNPQDDRQVYIPLDIAREIFEREGEIDAIYVQVKSGFEPTEIAEDIKEELREFRNEKEGEETFSIQTFEQILESFNTIFGIVQAVLVGIAGISLLVGGIGIMNTMYTSVLERTKEIGIMKAVGARNSDILLLFLVESGLLGLFGGFIGIVIGLGFAKAVEFIISNNLGVDLLKVAIDPVLITGSLLFAFVIGSLSGMFPARQAARMKPVDALRYE